MKSLASSRLFWATVAFIGIVGGTLFEDVLSGGAGISDDLSSLGAAASAASLILGL